MRNMRFDFLLAGKGYILAQQKNGARSWLRESTPDTPVRLGSRTEENAEYGGVDPQLDYPEVWNDWSGGYGHAYRTADKPNTYHWSENFDARFPNQLVHCQAPQTLKGYATGSPTHSTFLILLERVDEMIDSTLLTRPSGVGYGKTLLLGRSGWVMGYPTGSSIQIERWQGGTTGSGTFNDDGSQNLHPAATYGSYLWYGLSQAGNGYFYGIPASGNLVTASVSGFRLAVAGNQLWKAGGPDPEHAVYLQNCGNPAGVASPANWGATYNIGEYQAPIRDLIAVDDQVLAGTAIGLYAGDQTGTFVNVLPELRHQVHPDNCRDLAVWQGAVIVQHVAGVFGYRPSTGSVEDMGVPMGDRSPVSGVVRAVKGYGRWLYAARYTGSWSWLLAGARGDNGRMAWHTLQRFPHNTKVGRLFVDGTTTATGGVLTANRFWASTEASIDPGGTAPVYLWQIPTLDGNPLSGSPGFTPNFVASARIEFGASDWGAPGTSKIYRSLEMVSENLYPDQGLAQNTAQVDAYYTIDGGTRTLLGTFVVSPKQTLYFPSGEGSFVTGQSIVISLESRITQGYWHQPLTVSPVIRSVVLRGSLQPRYIDQITAAVRTADEITDRQGQAMRSGQTQLKELRDLASQTQAHELVDLTGATWMVKLMGPPIEQEVWAGVGEQARPEVQAQIKMAVMTFTAGTSGAVSIL